MFYSDFSFEYSSCPVTCGLWAGITEVMRIIIVQNVEVRVSDLGNITYEEKAIFRSGFSPGYPSCPVACGRE